VPPCIDEAAIADWADNFIFGIQVQIEALESQKLAAAAIVKNSRYMLMSVVMATIATTITPAGLVFNIISLARVLR
jgi:hypothetical protein